MTRICRVIVLLGLSICCCNVGTGTTWYVDCSVSESGQGQSWETAFRRIYEGIFAANDGDTVIVAQGTYVENIEFNGKNILLRSTYPLDSNVVEKTIIDGDQSGSVVSFCGREDESCVLSGFTIRKGRTLHDGGGIFGGRWSHTHATIKNNVIAGNSASRGGGVACCDGAIVNNIIAENSGGGLYRCDGTIENNTLSVNSGSGLYDCHGTIRNCIVWGNRWTQLSHCSPPSYSCIEGWRDGGEGNIAFYPYFADAECGDFHLKRRSPCIDAGDRTSPFSQEPEPNGGRINMGAYGNTLEAASASPDTDHDGLPDDWEIESFADVAQGADHDPDGDLIPNIEEYHRGLSPISSPSLWYVKASMPTSGEGTSWETAFKTIQEGIDAASYGDMVIVGQGTYFENIHFKGKSIVLRSTEPLDSSVVRTTIIDGNQAGPVVTFAGIEEERCILSGFTIRNGNRGNAGGIGGRGTHATIQNNVVTENCGRFGGGLDSCNGTIRNNIISRNSVYGTGQCGSAMYCCRGTIENNTIVGNSALPYQKYFACLCYCDGRIRNCIIWANRGGSQFFGSRLPSYSCIERWSGGGEGNIDYYPYLVNFTEGDYHLERWSPCIDAGDPFSPFSREPEPNGRRVNMGAYGNTPQAAAGSADTDRDGLPDDWEMEFLGDPAYEASHDPDSDGISNLQEYHLGFDPASPSAWYVDQSVTIHGDGTSWVTAFKTIQEGIDAAVEGHRVVVAQGTYVENVGLKGKNIVLRSTDPLDPHVIRSTIIDGSEAGSAVGFAGTENESCVLEGFTIRKGRAALGGGILGGWESQTHATIRNNIISENHAQFGGGLYGCDGTIEGNTVSVNEALSGGGGLYGCNGKIRNNVITENSARWSPAQSPSDTPGGKHATVRRLSETYCRRPHDSQGGILYFDPYQTAGDGGGLSCCHGIIRNNIIIKNSAHCGGGLNRCNGIIRNNIIAGNAARNSPYVISSGGGLFSCDGIILNNTVVGNSAARNGAGIAYCEGTVCNCIIWANEASESGDQTYESSVPTYSCIQDWAGAGEGNIAEDPGFADADGCDNDPETYEDNDYRLRPDSRCIDAGDNFVLNPPGFDRDGNLRIAFGRIALTVDMGAYEYSSVPFAACQVGFGPGGELFLVWNSQPNDTYTVWIRYDLLTGRWRKFKAVASEGAATSCADFELLHPYQRATFYRVEMGQ